MKSRRTNLGQEKKPGEDRSTKPYTPIDVNIFDAKNRLAMPESRNNSNMKFQNIMLEKTKTSRATNVKGLRENQGTLNKIFDTSVNPVDAAYPAKPLNELRSFNYENTSFTDKSEIRTQNVQQNPNIDKGEAAAGYTISELDTKTNLVDEYNKKNTEEKYQS